MLEFKPFSLDDAPWELLELADPSREQIAGYLARGEGYAAYVGDDLVGALVLEAPEPGVVEIMNIAVAEDRQGTGIGKLLITEAIRLAREQSARRLDVGTGNSSIMQLGFYQKCGFRIVGVDLDFFTRNYPEPLQENGIPCRDMIRMTMELAD